MKRQLLPVASGSVSPGLGAIVAATAPDAVVLPPHRPDLHRGIVVAVVTARDRERRIPRRTGMPTRIAPDTRTAIVGQARPGIGALARHWILRGAGAVVAEGAPAHMPF